MDIQKAIDRIQSDIDGVNTWAEEEYKKYFTTDHFERCRQIYKLMQMKGDKITDSDLEWVLTCMPFELLQISEELSKLQIAQEVIKLSIKDQEDNRIAELTEADPTMSISAKREIASRETRETKLLVQVYSNIQERVNHEMTFSKELIMSCKKVWDARRGSEINPVGASSPQELPEYHGDLPGTYIK